MVGYIGVGGTGWLAALIEFCIACTPPFIHTSPLIKHLVGSVDICNGWAIQFKELVLFDAISLSFVVISTIVGSSVLFTFSGII